MNTPDTRNQALVDITTAASLCDGLASYTLVYVTGTLFDGRPETTWKLMARDMPRAERRFTNLNSGTEVFDIGAFMSTVRATEVVLADEKDQAFLALAID
jgi:hypothetical protein